MISLPSIVSINASEKFAKEISTLYKLKMLRSVRHIVECIQKITHEKYDDLFSKIKILSDEKNNVTSEAYCLNYKLIAAIKEKKSIKLAVKAIQDFMSIPSHKIIKKDVLIENINKHHWAMEFMDCTQVDANTINGNDFSEISPVDNRELFFHSALIQKCLNSLNLQLNTHDFSQEINQYVSYIILYDGFGITGASSSRTMGTIYIRIHKHREKEALSPISLAWLPPFAYYLEQLIHETAHLHLDQIMAFDPIVLNSDLEKFTSPIRKDPRPMRGIFHATYVLARLYLFYNLYDFKTEWSEEPKNKRKDAIKAALKRGLNVINKSALLTEKGKILTSEINDLIKIC